MPASPLPTPPPVASLKFDVNYDSPLLECLDSVLPTMYNDSSLGNSDFSQSPLQSAVPQLPVQCSLDTKLSVERPKDFSCPMKLPRCDLCSLSPSPMPALVPCHPRESPVSVSASSGPSVIFPKTPTGVPNTPFTPPMVSHRRESVTKFGLRNLDASKSPPALASQGIVT